MTGSRVPVTEAERERCLRLANRIAKTETDDDTVAAILAVKAEAVAAEQTRLRDIFTLITDDMVPRRMVLALLAPPKKATDGR